MAFFAFLGLMFGLERGGTQTNKNFADSVGATFTNYSVNAAVGITIGLAIGFSIYLMLYHLPIKKRADAVQLSVDGPFLRFREGFLFKRDRRLHFRSIVDYAYYEGPLMRYCGIAGISMNTMSGGQNCTIQIPAVKDAEKVRDLLSEIDRQREDEVP